MPVDRAQQLLSSALTFRDAPTRTAVLPATFASASAAVEVWTDVLLHEAHEAMRAPLASRPQQPYLHPVDMDSPEPGIVASRATKMEILRVAGDAVPRVQYRARRVADVAVEPPHAVRTATAKASETAAAQCLAAAIRRGERLAAGAETRDAAREARKNETPEDRSVRLQEQRAKRAERKRARDASADADGAPAAAPADGAPARTRPAASVMPDASFAALARADPPASRARFYEHPLPHHRHLSALHRVRPHAALAGALLDGTASDALEIVQGPPGTGKTARLVAMTERVAGRVLLCAPTNVGAANLYARCVAHGLADECALVLPPDRMPPGTAVRSNDPARRLVCTTISSRCGPVLDAHAFDAVLVDEAAQCMEAWVWTLLRPEVAFLALAGDVHQLPAVVSESGRALVHDRSLMARLVLDLAYDNVCALAVQNRMAPELLRFPNEHFYAGALTSGPHAPAAGRVDVVVAADGREAADGTSFYNAAEVDAIVALTDLPPDAVLLCPYTAQCRRVLARGLGREVHTVDSFQGREADVVVVTLVRDGSSGFGFWSDYRRAVVAFTRARVRLVVVVSHPERWASTPLAPLLAGAA